MIASRRRKLAVVALGLLALAPSLSAQSEKAASPEPDREYEIIRISRPDGTVTTLRVPRRTPLLLARNPVRDRLAGRSSASDAPETAHTAFGPHGRRFATSRASSSAPAGPEAAKRSASRTILSDPRTGERRELASGPFAEIVKRAVSPRVEAPLPPMVGGDSASEWRTGRGWKPSREGEGGGSYIRDLVEVLVAGVEFGGETPDPPAVGNEEDAGYDAEAVARWDVVPHQTISGDFEVGLLAFHMNGIDRVEVSLEGGPWTQLRSMQVNPRTGVREYVAMISGDDVNLATGEQIELRAIAYPTTAGKPRLLTPLYLYVNNDGSLSPRRVYVALSGSDSEGDGSSAAPFATIKKALNVIGADLGKYDGAEIVVGEAGRYDIDQPTVVNNERWITIRPGGGLSREDVVIAAGSTSDLVRPNTRRLRFSGLKFDFGDMLQLYKEDPHQQWHEGCVWTYGQGWTYVPPSSISPVRNVGYGGLFITECESRDSIYAFITANLVRNCTADRISGDVFQNSLMVVQSSASFVDGTVLTHHSDLLQYFGHFENLIVYNVNAAYVTATQNIFLDHANSSFTNCAFVNVAVQNTQSDPPFSQLNSAHDHVLFQHVTNPGQRFVMRDDFTGEKKFTAKNVVFRNCVVERLQAADYFGPIPEGVSIDHCHFNYNEPRGESPTVGAIFLMESSGGYFVYKGYGATKLPGSARYIPGLSDSTSPDRGARPWGVPR